MRYGAAAGALGVLLFAGGGLLVGERPGFDAPGSELAAYYAGARTRVEVACALFGAAVPLLVWFLVTAAGPARRRAGTTALASGVVFLTLFLADVTSLAVAALRPRSPDLLVALRDFELLAMGVAAFAAAAMLAALSTLPVWPRVLGRLAAAAGALYLLRVGTLFTTDGPFAADGVLGFWVPVAAIATWIFAASVALALRPSA